MVSDRKDVRKSDLVTGEDNHLSHLFPSLIKPVIPNYFNGIIFLHLELRVLGSIIDSRISLMSRNNSSFSANNRSKP